MEKPSLWAKLHGGAFTAVSTLSYHRAQEPGGEGESYEYEGKKQKEEGFFFFVKLEEKKGKTLF